MRSTNIKLNKAEKYMKFIMRTFFVLLFSLFNSAYADNQASKGVGYATVDAALSALKARPDVTFTKTEPDGWLIGTDQATFAVWSFTPQGHYAYPAVVKREVKQNAQGQVFIETSALCEANKIPCDRLMNDFVELNGKVREDVRKQNSQQFEK